MNIGDYYQGISEREEVISAQKKQKKTKTIIICSACVIVGVVAAATATVIINRNIPKKEQEAKITTLDLPEKEKDESSSSSELTLEEIERIKRTISGEFESETTTANVTNIDLPAVGALEVGGALQQGYNWAVDMSIIDAGACDQFSDSHGQEFVNGCKEAAGRTRTQAEIDEEAYQKLLNDARNGVKSQNPTPRPTPIPSPVIVSGSIPSTPAPTSEPTINIGHDYSACISTIDANPFISEGQRRAAIAACAQNEGDKRGCCSSHGGTNSCVGAKVICNDGTFSPTCRCI